MATVEKLENLDSSDSSRWGRKAAVLALLTRRGYNVPPAVVLEALPGDLSDEDFRIITTTAAGLGDGPLAVRSSSANEDGPESAAAGRYVSILDVRGEAGLLAAVAACRASADGSPLAVIIQKLVPATAAGVAFSVNPVSGDATQAVVNAVRGLGDELASGEASPDQWIVTDQPVRSSNGGPPALTPGQARQVASLARRAAQDLGAPQDIEWALAGDQLFLLQSRPVTALVKPVPIPVDVPAGYWHRESVHWPLPRTPMTRSVLDSNAAMEVLGEKFGLLVAGSIQEIGGWAYMALLPVGGPPRGLASRLRPPSWLLPVLLQLNPTTRRQLQAAKRAEQEDLVNLLVDRWYTEYLPQQRKRLRELRNVDLPVLDDAGLARHLRDCRALLQHSMMIHYEVLAPPLFTTAELARFCDRELGWTFDTVLGLLAGTSSVSSEPARVLAAIAADSDPTEKEHRLRRYRQDFGLRALTAELSDATLAERPQLLELQLEATNGPALAEEEQALEDRRQSLAQEARSGLQGKKLLEFNRLLGRAQRAYPIRDDNAFYTFDSPFALLRYAVLQAGARMLQAGAILVLDDVFYCEVDEVIGWLEQDGPELDPPEPDGPDASGGARRRTSHDLKAAAARRRGERAWALAHPGPATYGPKPGRPPSLRWLPRASRTFMESLAFAMEHALAEAMSERAEPDDATHLTGVAASGGTYTGPAKVILNESDFGRIERGDVLVCPSTRPSWSVIFPALGAIVTDSGGALSHPAIIAREHRIPAVVATAHATSVLRDGQMVTVDGSAGTVTFDVKISDFHAKAGNNHD